MSTLPQEATIFQAVASGSQNAFPFLFYIFQASISPGDILVYVTPSGQVPNPSTDLQVLNTAYTVMLNSITFPGQPVQGTVNFVSPTYTPPVNSLVTLVSNVAIEFDFDFTQAVTINGGNLNSAFERLTIVAQQLQTFYNTRALQYVQNYNLLTQPASNQLPSLFVNSTGAPTQNQVWMSVNNTIQAVQLTSQTMTALAALLAIQSPTGADGTNLIGYYNTYTSTAGTLNNFLNNGLIPLIQAQQTQVSTGVFTPTITPGSGSFSVITYLTQHGEYVKTANQVVFSLEVSLSALTIGGAGGSITINGLPFSNTFGGAPQCTVAVGGITFSGYLTAEVRSNTLVLNSITSATPIDVLNVSTLSSSTLIRITGSYFTA